MKAALADWESRLLGGGGLSVLSGARIVFYLTLKPQRLEREFFRHNIYSIYKIMKRLDLGIDFSKIPNFPIL